MKRRPTSAEDDAGQDSFLDIVANIVGILIILVLVAGLRVKNAAASAQANDRADDAGAAVAAEHELAGARHYLRELQGDIHDLHREESRLEAAQKDKSRDHVAWTAEVGKMQQRLEAARSQLDERSREQFDLNRQIDATRDKLGHVAEQHRAASDAPEAIEIEVLPTPLSKTVNDQQHELHFRLLDGKIARVPINALMEDVKQAVHDQLYKFRDRDRLIDTVGPRRGFSLRYRIDRVNRPGSLGGYGVMLRYAAIIPSGHEPSETASEALSAGSRFRQTLSAADRRKAAVTLWVYPDAYAAFRSLRKYLYQNNWQVSARPLPFSSPIAISPNGSKSAAQ
ncbi:MAG: hypothetical protein IID44_18050 [Planctomycetes bacterium]|nr:hypothetical protein [Planctomycetota bacterium]